jgi:hypothetical protein
MKVRHLKLTGFALALLLAMTLTANAKSATSTVVTPDVALSRTSGSRAT